MCKKKYSLVFCVLTQICILAFPFVLGVKPCLTWDVFNSTTIRFVCRVPHYNVPITFKDNLGFVLADCTFFNNVKSCQPMDSYNFVRVNYKTNSIEIYVKKEYLDDFEGEWTCRFGKEDLTTSIYLSKGIISTTKMRLDIIKIDADTVRLKCWSCREPDSNNVEFRINGRSEDSITYKKLSGQCIHQNIPCEPSVCGCASSGNEFFISIKWNRHRNDTFSCDMIFTDTITSAKFSLIADIEFNGTGFTHKDIRNFTYRHGDQRVTETTPFRPDYTEITVSSDLSNATNNGDSGKHHIVSSDLSNATNNGDSGKHHIGHLVQWIIIGVLIIFVILLIGLRLRETILSWIKGKSVVTVDAEKNGADIPLLERQTTLKLEDTLMKTGNEISEIEINPILKTTNDSPPKTGTEETETERHTILKTEDTLMKTGNEISEIENPTVLDGVNTGKIQGKQDTDTKSNSQRHNRPKRIFCPTHGYFDVTHTCKDMIAGRQVKKKSPVIFETKSVTEMLRHDIAQTPTDLSKTM